MRETLAWLIGPSFIREAVGTGFAFGALWAAIFVHSLHLREGGALYIFGVSAVVAAIGVLDFSAHLAFWVTAYGASMVAAGLAIDRWMPPRPPPA